MNITAVSALNSSQKEEICAVLSACKEKEALSLSFPFGEEALYVLVSDGACVRTAAAFLFEEEGVYECAAFTHPDFRGRGFFSAALEAGLSMLPEEAEILFMADGRCQDTLQVLEYMGAELVSEEYMMELAPPAAGALGDAYTLGGLTMEETQIDGTRTFIFSDAFGALNISVCDSHYYLYGFEIHEDFRGKGHGKALLRKVLHFLSSHKNMPVTLQVSGSNCPAVSLYEKTGFRITETLSCYLY